MHMYDILVKWNMKYPNLANYNYFVLLVLSYLCRISWSFFSDIWL